VCVCFLLYLFSYLCCARCMFCVLFYIHNYLFGFFLLFPQNSIDIYVMVLIDVHIALLICLSSSFFYISICLIHAYVYVTLYKHFLPLPLLEFQALPDVYKLTTPCSRVSIPMFIRAYASYKYTHTMSIEKMFTSVCTSPSHMFILQHRLYPYLFHPPEHMLMCACLHQDCANQIKRIHVNKKMRNKIYIYAIIIPIQQINCRIYKETIR